MREHIVKIPIEERDPATKKMVATGRYRLLKPGIFRAVTDEEVEEADKMLKGYLAAKAGLEDETAMKWKSPFVHLVVFLCIAFVLSGALAWTLSLSQGSPFWISAKPNWMRNLASEDGKFFVIAIGVFSALTGFMLGWLRARAKITRLITAKKRWEKGAKKTPNDALIHLLSKIRNAKYEPAYSQGDVYIYAGKRLPPGVIKKAKNKKGETVELEWERFKRDGQFELILGEAYERDGRFNPEPRLVKIPTPGLFTGVFVVGPTGSGKSQSVLLPMLDQFIGYYSWIEDERRLWLYDMPLQIQGLEKEAEKVGGSKAAEIRKQIKKLEAERSARLQAYAEGKEGFFGHEAPFVFLLEPKAEMFADMHKIAKRYGRERHYLELGTVREKYDAYLTWRVRADQASSRMWAYWGEPQIEAIVRKWLVDFAKENALLGGTPNPKDEAIVNLPKAVFADRSTDVSPFQVVTDQFLSLKEVRKQYAKSGSSEDPSGDLEERLRYLSMGVAAPFCFPIFTDASELASMFGGISNTVVPDPKAVGPLGFGTANEPWIMRRRVKRPLNAQAIYTDAFNAVCSVYLALGWNFTAGDEGESEEGVFRRKMWGANMLTPLGPDESDTFFLSEILNTFREDASLGSHGDPEDICFSEIPMPRMNVAGLIYPAAAKARSAEEKSKGENQPTALADQIREALADLPANRKEAAQLRAVMRTVAPPAKSPGELRVDFRNRVAFWWEERKRMKFQFVEALLRGFSRSGNRGGKNLEDLDKALGGDPLALRVMLCFGDITPAGVVEAAMIWFQNSRVTALQAMECLVAAGWTARRTPGESDYEKGKPYDYYMANCLEEPDEDNYKAKFGGANAKISISEWHQRNRRIEERKEIALLVGMLNRPSWVKDERVVASIFEAVRRIVLEAIQASDKKGSLKDLVQAVVAGEVNFDQGRDIWTLLDEADKGKGVRYHYDPRIDLGEQISDAEEDIRAMVDVLPRWMRLGPWDGVWSEGIGLRVWEPLREVMRGALNRASNLMGEREAELVNDVFKQEAQQHGGGLPPAARNFLGGYRVRREKVLEESLNYLSAVEDYMKTLAPLHKCDVPFAYGYKDFGGIGDCQGLSKFNPLHSPGQNPNQLAAAMMAVLNRNAGSGDTSFWADAGVMVSENIFALLRAAYGYVTVAWLFQAVTSDAFADLALAQAARRIRLIEAAQSGVGEDEPAKPILGEVWAKRHQLHESAIGEGQLAIPASLSRLLPKVESEIELRQLREYLETSQAFITKDWRGTNGSFADPEVKSTVKLNLLQQLTPLTKDIGGYSFSPEDVDSISFPTFEEARNAANIIVTRFQQTIDPKLGGLVVGMAKQQYQAMVLGAKGRITSGDIIRNDIANRLPSMRKTLAEVRAKRAEVATWLEPFMRTRRDLGVVNDNLQSVIKEVLADAHGRVNDPQVLAEMLSTALFDAENSGRLGGAMTSECNYSLPSSHQAGVGGAARVNTGLAVKSQGLYAATESALRLRLKATLSQRDEEIANRKDLKKRYDTQVWRSRQEILNLLSRRDQLANNTRLCLFCIDEAQGYVVFSSKGDSISEEKFLGEARAGCSVNVYCTQAPAAIKTAASQEQFQYFISNMRTQIVLGAPNEPDQKMLSDLWQGEEVTSQKDGGVNVSYEGVEKNAMTGEITAAKSTSASKGYNTVTEFKKYVEGYHLRDVPTFRSWAAVFDGTTTHKPQMLAHVPYYLISDVMSGGKYSAITNEPLCTKPFVSLLRDGEVSLPPLESMDVREMLNGLRQTGADVDEDIEQAERLALLLKKEA